MAILDTPAGAALYEALEGLRESMEDPQWDKAGKVHDWRNYVGERTRAIWDTLDSEQKLAIAEDAQDRADTEDWE